MVLEQLQLVDRRRRMMLQRVHELEDAPDGAGDRKVMGDEETPTPGEALPRLRWEQICRRPDCRGRWVALHECTYDHRTGKATDGELVDVDDDLASLCNRVRDSHWKDCAILYCGETPSS